MAFRRCLVALPMMSLLLAAGLIAGAPAAAAGKGHTGRELAVFWGRNKDEGSLREACDTGRYTTVIISFLSSFGCTAGRYTLDLSGHPLRGVGADIKHCQARGVMVLLSIGGQGGEYSLPDEQAAADLAEHIWKAYSHGSAAGVRRPFGDAAVDGVDFFIDQGSTEYYDELAERLYAYDKYNRGWGVKLTATVSCAYPDERMDAALETGLFNRIHARIYGDDDCSGDPRASWERWAEAYPGTPVLLGVVASPEADPHAYMSQKDLYDGVLQFINKVPNYGGMMIWSRYYDRKTGYTGGKPTDPSIRNSTAG